MIDTIEKLLQDYASYSFMEGTIDEDTMNHLVEDVQNYIEKLNELNLLRLHFVSKKEFEEAKEIAYNKGRTKGYWEGHSA